jgi:hypothetical protein
MKHEELRKLDNAEIWAWKVKMGGPEADACTIWGKEGKNELAWRKAAAACAAYREKHGLVGKRGY